MLHDIIVGFFLFAGIIFGYLFFMWWLKWFYDNYEVKRRKK